MRNQLLSQIFTYIIGNYMLYVFGYRKVMLRVDAKQGAPKDGNSPLELFQVMCSVFLPVNGLALPSPFLRTINFFSRTSSVLLHPNG